jgi:transposase
LCVLLGKKLNYIKQKKYRNRLVSIYTSKECNNCHRFGKCTTDKNGRSIWVSEYAHFVKKMRQKLSTSEGKKIYGLRKITVEPVFGNLSQNLGFREFLLRGKEKVKGEFSLMCTAHNILAKSVRCSGKTLKEILTIPEPVLLIDSS